MRISQKTEWILIAALIAYIAFTPGLPAVRQLLSTNVGKAVALAAVVAVWKHVSPVVALLLTVSLVRCASMREYMENGSTAPPTASGPPPNTYCPDNHSFDNGQCKNLTTGQTIPATVCLTGQTWDGTKCVGGSSSTPSTPPPAMPPPPSMSSTTTKQPFTLMSAAPVGGVQPDVKETFYAPA